jgi:hypothetical protein
MSNRKFHLVAPDISKHAYNKTMNKRVVLLFATVFSILGGYVPVLFGNNDLLSGWSILMGIVGGIFGIWLGVVVSKRIE